MNKAQTFYLIGSILSLDFTPRHRDSVLHTIRSANINWNGFVKLGSDNLVLPAIWLNLNKHNLTQFLPAELDVSLREILDLNRQRNRNVRAEATYVNDLLLQNDIDCLFMKGTGNMLDGFYSDTGERMVYDLDVLVDDDNMLKAANLLHGQGFITQKKFNVRALESTMHYPILLREDLVAGVEIHRMPVQFLYQKNFTSSMVFRNHVKASEDTRFGVMCYRDRIIHNFLHAQLMHNGHYHADVSLRDLYDLLLLSRKENLLKIFIEYGHYKKKSIAYLKLMYKVFDLDMPGELRQSPVGRFFLWRQQKTLEMSNRKLDRYHLLIMLLQKYLVLPFRVLWNSKARNYVFSRLTDLSWYQQHIKAIKRRLKQR